MQRASDLFSDEQRATVDEAVAEAESKTSAEIVPVVATASGRYDRAEDIVGLWCSLLAVVVLWILLPRQSAEAGDWAAGSSLWQVVVLIVAFVAAFVGGTVAGCKVAWLRRLFTPRKEMEDDVAARAREIFFDNRIHHTAANTGVLIYVSLFERMAAVIGDEQVLEKLGQESLDDLCRELTDALHTGPVTDAICKTIRLAGDRLADVLPREEDDVNELSDSLVTID